MRLRRDVFCRCICNLKEAMLSFSPTRQSSTEEKRGQRASCNACSLSLFISCPYLLEDCMWANARSLAWAYTPLPTGPCDHIPADMPFRSLVTSAGVSKWQGLFVYVLICSEETGADSLRRYRKRGATTSPPHPPTPHHTKCHPSPGCGAHPAILLKRADI